MLILYQVYIFQNKKDVNQNLNFQGCDKWKKYIATRFMHACCLWMVSGQFRVENYHAYDFETWFIVLIAPGTSKHYK